MFAKLLARDLTIIALTALVWRLAAAPSANPGMLGHQRHETRDAQFRRFFHQPTLAICLGQSHAQHERRAELAINGVSRNNR